MKKTHRSFDNVLIHYDLHKKSANFIVFLHGAGGNLRAWDKEKKFFQSKGYSTLALDLRGHGLSERPQFEKDYHLTNFAKDIDSVLEKENVKNFVLVGHCFGGVVSIMYDKLYHNKAGGFCLVDSTYKAPNNLKDIFNKHPYIKHIANKILEKQKAFINVPCEQDYRPYVGTGDWNISRIINDIFFTSFKSWLFTFENLAKFNGVKILKDIKKPVLVVEGDKDSIFDMLISKKINRLAKKSKLEIVPDANHILVLNNPEVLNQELFNFIRTLKF